MKNAIRLLAACLPLVWTRPAPAATPLPDGTYIYSDFCAGSHGWDIAGHRVEFQHSTGGGDAVMIRFSEWGGDAGPIAATPVHFNPATGALQFSYQTGIDDYSFDGIATETGLTGTFEYDQDVVTLPVVPSDAPVKAKCAPGRN